MYMSQTVANGFSPPYPHDRLTAGVQRHGRE